MAKYKNKQGNITDKPIPKDLADRVREKIIQVRVNMLWTQPFFGSLIMRLQLAPADAWLGTMAVDGKYLYYNHAFVDSLTLEELLFVFSHEILHLCYDHIGRNGDRNRRLYNVAADYVVNDELIETHIGKFPTEMIKGVETPVGLYDPKYHGWNSERVYDELLKEQQQQEQSNPGSGESSLSEMLDKLLDEHLDPKSGEGDGNSESGGGDTPGKSGPAKLTDEERAQLKAEMTEHILNAAKTCSAGNLPGGIKRMIQDLTDPKMNWRELIQTTIDSLIPCDYSYLKMNRKGWGLDAVLPGMTTDKMLKVAVFIDMSGSIGTEQARSFLSEVNGMMQQFQNYEILVGCFDTEVQNVQTFSADNGEDIRTYQPMGGGGTSFECIFDYLKEESIIPETLCIFTDGYPNNTFGDEFYCPTIFLIEGSKVVPPFGQYAYIEEGDLK